MVALRLDLGVGANAVDLAVLDLGDDPPAWLPAPVPVRATARMPPSVEAFGYPLAEARLTGLWRTFTVAGPTAGGTVQLDRADEAGAFPGQSGGPVIDPSSYDVAGILVAGSQQGRFDRFLPILMIAQCGHSYLYRVHTTFGQYA